MVHRHAAIGLVLALQLAHGTTGQVRTIQPHGAVLSFVVTIVQEMWLANGYPGVRGETRPVRVETRVWYAAPDRWRIERYHLKPPAEPALVGVFEPNPNVTVRNGPIAWTYDASSHTYASRSPLSSAVAPSGPPLQFEAAALGESFPSTAPSLPALVKGLAACDTARIVPISRPQVVGRPINLLDVGPQFGGLILWWDQGRTYIALSSPTLSKAQLMRVATSM